MDLTKKKLKKLSHDLADDLTGFTLCGIQGISEKAFISDKKRVELTSFLIKFFERWK